MSMFGIGRGFDGSIRVQAKMKSNAMITNNFFMVLLCIAGYLKIASVKGYLFVFGRINGVRRLN